MTMTPVVTIIIAVFLAGWMAIGAWLMFAGRTKYHQASVTRKTVRRLFRMMDEAPAIPVLVRSDGRIEASERLADWLGLEKLPHYLSELGPGADESSDSEVLDQAPGGLTAEQISNLISLVERTQKSGQGFVVSFGLPSSGRVLAFKGALGDPQVLPGGSALLWVFDQSDSQQEVRELREEALRNQAQFLALADIVKIAPIPIWYRDSDGRLLLVNDAYARATGAKSPDNAVRDEVELIESVDGLTAAQIAQQVATHRLPAERIVAATIAGERRSVKIVDLPSGNHGVAGYAIDVEEVEDLAREFRAFKSAQRSMLDQLSVGVGQFDRHRELIFANQPFRRIFKLHSGAAAQKLEFSRFLDNARDDGRLPEMRDFPAWRDDILQWFTRDTLIQERWPLIDGTHLRIVGQPMPDGGLVLIAEDQTEALAVAAQSDMLLRTRTATLDSLFEALAVFSHDGRLQMWNRSFAQTWGIEPALLDEHPNVRVLVTAIKQHLINDDLATDIENVIRSATLDRQNRGGRLGLKDGRTLEFAGVPLPDGNGLLTTLDVTANEKVETALRERNAALEAADEVKTRFLSNMSYELRTPLTSIGGFAEMMQAGLAGPLSVQGQEYTQAILDSVARLTDQVENILDLSQSEAGLMPMNSVEVDCDAFLAAICSERLEVAKRAEVTLDFRPQNAACPIHVDKRQMARAVTHLVNNAIAVSPRGGVVIMRALMKGGVLHIIISDKGRGMTQAEINRAIGDDSHVALRHPGEKDEAHGLGLKLAKQLIEAHGGNLKITSEVGVGTIATIVLPP